MRDPIVITLAAVMLVACGGGGGGQDSALPTIPGIKVVSLQPSPASTNISVPEPSPPAVSPPAVSLKPNPQLNPYTWGAWASFNQGYFRVEETMWSATGSDWRVHGTPTGLVDNMPQRRQGQRSYNYLGHVWGRVYEGRTGRGTITDEDDGDRVNGQIWAVYLPRDYYGPGADDALTILFRNMYKELRDGGRSFLPGMIFQGDVGTNRNDPDYDPALDTATFSLPADQFETTPGLEDGEVTGSFYGPNGEALAGTFWYRRSGHRIEGAFGAERE